MEDDASGSFARWEGFFITQMSIELEASAYVFLGSVSKVRGRLQFGGLLDRSEEIEARTQDGLELPRAHTSMLYYT